MGNKHLINKILKILLLLVLFGFAFIAILLVVKPGAAIFHFKQNVNIEEISLFDGQAYRYAINRSALIFPAEGGLLYEDGQLLNRTFTAEVIEEGSGRYSVVNQEDGGYFLTLSATDDSDPRTNKKAYTLYFKPVFQNRCITKSIQGIITRNGCGSGNIPVFRKPGGDMGRTTPGHS